MYGNMSTLQRVEAAAAAAAAAAFAVATTQLRLSFVIWVGEKK